MGAEWMASWAGREGAVATNRITNETPSLQREYIDPPFARFSNQPGPGFFPVHRRMIDRTIPALAKGCGGHPGIVWRAQPRTSSTWIVRRRLRDVVVKVTV